jgi:hypothetical protein
MIKGRMWWEWLFLAAVIVVVIDAWIHPKPSLEGKQCGPQHHWRYSNNDLGNVPDLSCEPD